MAKAHAVFEGKAYCGTCYKREFKPVPCAECGRTVRTLQGRGPATCKCCRSKNRSCLRCGKPVPRAALTLENGVACPSCARYYKPAKACANCGQRSQHLARDFKLGFEEPVCPKCRRKGHATCACCGKHRAPAGKDDEGRPLCQGCLKRKEPFTCPRCGRQGRYHSQERCSDCYWGDRLGKKISDNLWIMNQRWLRDAFQEFGRRMRIDGKAQKIAVDLDRHVKFFHLLDQNFSCPEEVRPRELIRVFGLDGLRRASLPFGFLVSENYLPEMLVEELRREAEFQRQESILEDAEDAWFHPVLKRFHLSQSNRRKRFESRGWEKEFQRYAPRSVTQDLKAAVKFLKFLPPEIGSIQEISEKHLDAFLLNHPGYRNGLRNFIWHLNQHEKTFVRFKIPTTKQGRKIALVLGQDKFHDLLESWSHAPDREVNTALIALFMMLYAQKARRVLRMRLSDLHHNPDGSFSTTFGDVEIPLSEILTPLIERHLEQREKQRAREGHDLEPYLFPGRRVGSHLSESSVTQYLHRYQVSAAMLFATGMFNALSNGLRQAKTLKRAFGVSDMTAAGYYEVFGARLFDEVSGKMRGNDGPLFFLEVGS